MSVYSQDEGAIEITPLSRSANGKLNSEPFGVIEWGYHGIASLESGSMQIRLRDEAARETMLIRISTGTKRISLVGERQVFGEYTSYDIMQGANGDLKTEVRDSTYSHRVRASIDEDGATNIYSRNLTVNGREVIYSPEHSLSMPLYKVGEGVREYIEYEGGRYSLDPIRVADVVAALGWDREMFLATVREAMTQVPAQDEVDQAIRDHYMRLLATYMEIGELE